MALLDELAERGLLEQTKAEEIEKESKKSTKTVEQLILERKLIPEETLFTAKSQYLGYPLKEVDPQQVSLKVLDLIPIDTAKHYKMIALKKEGSDLHVGMVYPEDLDAREALKFLARRHKFESKIFLITPSTFNKVLKQHRNLKQEVGEVLQELKEEFKGEEEAGVLEKMAGGAAIERLAEEAPISKVVAVILRYSVEGEASDIHIEPGRDKLRVRFRLMGDLFSSIFLPMRIHKAVVSRIKVLSNLKIDETRVPQDGRFATTILGRNIDFRVSTFPTTLGEKVVIRVLDPEKGLRNFSDLGMREHDTNIVQKAIEKPYGMILSTGPTGSGKTTTLYAVLQILNKEKVNIVTLEDPVEYFMAGVNQSQVRPEIGYTFANGLRSILRQDPDIVMVGEIRDHETASLATHAALTGHIVLSTLHTNDALGVIPRLIDLGIEPFLIPTTLSLCIAQRLVRRLCEKCKKKVEAKKEIKGMILKELDEFPPEIRKTIKVPAPFYIWEPVGCPHCNGVGFSGRIGVFEILQMTDQLEEIVLEETSEKKLREEAERQSMTTMRQDGILKVLNGLTTLEEVMRATQEK